MKLIRSIIDHIFGHKYYINIVNIYGTFQCESTSFIHATREAAEKHRRTIDTLPSFRYIETISFRSRFPYPEEKVKDKIQ